MGAAMPTYEYACKQCGQHVEVFQRLSEAPLTACGACGGPLRKVFHPAGIVFKGAGFYATDSRSKPKTSGDGAKKGSTTSSSPTDPSSAGSGASPAGSGSKPSTGGEKAS